MSAVVFAVIAFGAALVLAAVVIAAMVITVGNTMQRALPRPRPRHDAPRR